MDTPPQIKAAADEEEEITISHREYDGETVVAIDFGRNADVSFDTVGDTAIVVAGDRQFEFDVPSEATEITTNDGILTLKS